MHKKLIVAIVTAVVVPGAIFARTSLSEAASAGVDLGITGSTVAGFTRGQADMELPVVFTMTNHSSTRSTDVSFNFTITHATAGGGDYTCPLISNHYLINPDTPSCEPGVLGHGRRTSAAILVTPTITSGTVTVRACAQSLSNFSDPVPSNNCRTIRIPIE